MNNIEDDFYNMIAQYVRRTSGDIEALILTPHKDEPYSYVTARYTLAHVKARHENDIYKKDLKNIENRHDDSYQERIIKIDIIWDSYMCNKWSETQKAKALAALAAAYVIAQPDQAD